MKRGVMTRVRLVPPEVRRGLNMLTPADQRTYWRAVGLQMSTSLLDLAGVLAIGMVGLLVSAAVQGTAAPSPMPTILSWFGMADMSLSRASLIIAGVAAVLLILKTVIALWGLRWVTTFLSACSAQVAARMSAEFFALPIVRIQKFTSQWSAFALVHGVTGAIVNTLTNAMVIWVELTLLSVLTATLLLLDPVITIFAAAYFGVVGFALSRSVKRWATTSGEVLAETDVSSFSTVYDAIATYRELSVVNRRSFYIDRYRTQRLQGSAAYADQQFLGQLPRYAMEVALVVGAALLVAGLLMTGSVEDALGSLALFLAAATRVMPSILRLNGSRITLQTLAPRAEYAFTMADYIEQCAAQGEGVGGVTANPLAATSPAQSGDSRGLSISVRELTVHYPGSDAPALADTSFEVPGGGSLAVVGPSGGGKSTLADALLGVLQPSAGVVEINGMRPQDFVCAHPGQVAYVPQAVALVTGSVRDNVALGLKREEIDDERVLAALHRAHLADYLLDAREGLDTMVGERGVQLSGGQRQRLGIARALYADPRLIVMDEATSALDAETESLITSTLETLGSEVTTVTVAHRLATIRLADSVLYLDRGRLLAQGTFEQVRAQIPQFDHQAALLGL